MESKGDIISSLEIKIKLLEIENKKLLSTIETNNNQIQEFKLLIKSLSNNDSPNSENKNYNLNFNWKINNNAVLLNNKTIKKVTGGNNWNCSAVGDRCLIKGQMNKWKIQITKMNGPSIMIGIVPKDTDISVNTLSNWKKGYNTNLANFYKHNLGVATPFASHNTVEGNIFEIFVDLEKMELSFSANGNNLGIFCSNIIKDIEYVPFIDIQNVDTEIRLLE